MLAALYEIVIRPLEYLIEVVFRIMYDFLGNEGAAILSVSVLVSTLTLPLYLRSDAIQEEEQRKQKSMEPWVKRINATFSGDERYMMLQTYYREMGYRPLYALRGTISLLLQVPFFIAAYRYLSELQILRGASFGPIADLGAPDSLIMIGDFPIHLLPVLMTLINCISGTIYTKGFPLRQKLQIYILAAIFLLLLYESPAGLVLYWTMNNLYSLCKNIVQKYVREPKRFMCYVLSAVSVLYFVYLLFGGHGKKIWDGRDYEAMLFHFCLLLVLNFPILHPFLKRKQGTTPKKDEERNNKPPKWCAFVLEGAICIFLGAYIPLSVVSSSPADFVNLYNYISPLYYVGTTLCVSIGIFIVWGNVIYAVADGKGREIFSFILFAFLACALLDFMLFYPNIGYISQELVFDWTPKLGRTIRVVNGLALIAVFTLCVFLWKSAGKLVANISLIVLFVFIALSGYNTVRTQTKLSEIDIQSAAVEEKPALRLSTEERNVVVIMLDKAVGAYVPYLFAERPELLEQFDGFTFYPNTVSTGLCTNYGAPGLYGGYDYTTASMNARSDELLKDKHNEALLLMPRLFSEAGFTALSWEAPYGNYAMPSDLSIFDPYPDIHALHMEGRIATPFGEEEHSRRMRRSFFFYGIYAIAPGVLQDEIYDDGNYLSVDELAGDQRFLEAYAVLSHLGELTVTDTGVGSFAMICNNMTHEPTLLQLPDYTVVPHVDNSAYPEYAEDKELNGIELHFDASNLAQSLGHYHVNMRAFMELGQWFNELRGMGVYDNTRIILVADHGRSLWQMNESIMLDDIDVLAANALLMVKDFGATGFTTDISFMTNADVPALAMEGVIEDPINPYTGNPIDFSGKEGGVDIFWGDNADVYLNNGTTFEPADAHWYHFNGELLNEDSWYQLR